MLLYGSVCVESGRHLPSTGFIVTWLIHYANMAVQYIALFHGCKTEKCKDEILCHFLIFARQNIDHGYTLEMSRIVGSNEYRQSMF